MKRVNLKHCRGEQHIVREGELTMFSCPLSEGTCCSDGCAWFSIKKHNQDNGIGFVLCKNDVIAEIVATPFKEDGKDGQQ